MKKIIQDQQTLFINIKYLFEYSTQFATTVREQLLWMDKFYAVKRNIKHSFVDSQPDIIRLACKLQTEMDFHSNHQTSYKSVDLMTLGSETLEFSVNKLNKNMNPSISRNDHKKPIVDNKNKIHAMDVEITEAIGKAHNKWFGGDKLDVMFADRVQLDNE